MFSLYAFGKWAVAALAILGFYRAISVIVREAGNPALTLSARKQILLLALICIVPLLATVWLVSPSGDDALPQAAPPAPPLPADPRLPSVADALAPDHRR